MPHVPQTSDVWSLGCVLSIAATYVVLGTQGVLIYNQLRQQAIFNQTGSKSDAFHDGRTVLGEVLYWHQYLRETARQNDAYSSAVLDMVDRHMLVDGDNRWSANRVFNEFSDIMSIKAPKSRVPQELQLLLDNIDLQVEADYDHHSGIIRSDTEDLSKRIVPIRGPDPPGANIEFEFESWKQLLEQKILPVAQRSQNRTGSRPQSRSQSPSFDARPDLQQLSNTRAMLEVTTQDSSITNKQDTWESSHQSSSWQPKESPGDATEREPMTVWAVRDELEKNGMSWKPSLSSFSALVGKSQVSIRGKATSNKEAEELDSRLKVNFENRDIVSTSVHLIHHRNI